jgi:hypothetical protein
MALTQNATYIYLGTDFGEQARNNSFIEFQELWNQTIIDLGLINEKDEDDVLVLTALKSVLCMDFYQDARYGD